MSKDSFSTRLKSRFVCYRCGHTVPNRRVIQCDCGNLWFQRSEAERDGYRADSNNGHEKKTSCNRCRHDKYPDSVLLNKALDRLGMTYNSFVQSVRSKDPEYYHAHSNEGTVINNDEPDKIKDLLMFHKIVSVNEDTLTLDNGTELIIVPNEGCLGCHAGQYKLTKLNGCENAITNVEVVCEETPRDNPYEAGGRSYKIFVYAEDKEILLAQMDGFDGIGIYGTGYDIIVKVKGDSASA